MKIKNFYRRIILFIFLALIGFNINMAQGFKVKSPYRDLKVKVTGCEEFGNYVLVTLLFENTGNKDFDFSICGGYDNNTVAIDDEGNKFSVADILVKIGNSHYNQMYLYDKLYSGVPVKVTLKITDVPEYAKYFSLVNLWFNSNDIGVYEEHIKITNLPIYREGDD